MSIYDSQNRFAFPDAFYALNLKEFCMEPHAHNSCEIMYVVNGSCFVFTQNRRYMLKERQFVFLDQNVCHSLFVSPDTPCTLLNLEFTCNPKTDGVDLLELSRKSKEFHKLLESRERCILLNDSRKVGFALKDLISELERKETNDQYLLEILFTRTLIELSKSSTEDYHFRGIIHLKKAIHFIRAHLFEDIDVQSIAEFVGINHSYLQTLFSRQFNCGIISYVNNLRMDYASFLLKNSDKSVTDIAFHIGFNSRQHFGYVFKKCYHMSPTQYRRLNAQSIMADTGGSQLLIDKGGNLRTVPLSLLKN